MNNQHSSSALVLTIPYYSNFPLFQLCVQSILDQTDPDWVLHVCDEQPHNPSARDFLLSLSDARIHYHPNEKVLGIANNWNRCLQIAGVEVAGIKSNWVSIVHSDDALEKNYVSEMKKAIQENPQVTALFCDVHLIDENGQPTWTVADWVKTKIHPAYGQKTIVMGEPGICSLLKGNYIFCPSLIYQQKMIQDFKFDDQWGQVLDLEFTLRLLVSGHKIVGIPNQLYNYRRHSSNTTVKNTENLSRFDEEIKLFKKIEQECKKHEFLDAAKIAHRKRITFLNLGFEWVKALARFRFLRAYRLVQYYWDRF